MEIVEISLVLGVAFFAQGFVGFGGGLIGIPLMLNLGYALPQAVQVIAVGGLIQCIYSVRKLKSDINLKSVLPTMFGRLIFFFIGLYILVALKNLDRVLIKQYVGILCLLAILILVFFKPKKRESVPSYFSFLMGSISGLLFGSIGMGGPPLGIWVLLHNWSADRMKGSLFSIALPSYLIQIIVNIKIFNQEVYEITGKALLAFPIEILGIVLGMKLSQKVEKDVARRVMLGVLLLISLKSLCGF